MPRPLTGSLQQQPSGSWQAGLPVARGATQRHTPTFKKKEDAERWLEAGRRMLQAGRSLPEPDPAAATALHGRSGDADHSDPAFAIVCWWWHNEHYEDQRRAGPERTEQVATILSHHVIPYFDPGGAGLTADEVVRPRDIEQDPYRCIRFLKHLAGCDTEPAAAADGHALPDNRELTIAEATHACGVSRSTIKRQRRKGGLPGSYRDDTDGRVRIPVGDLRSAGLLGGTKGPGLSKTYAAGILWVLRSVFEHAIKYGWMTTDPSKNLTARAPDPARARTPRGTEKPRPLELVQCARVAAHCHLIHQVTLWLQRILGLRISESYGTERARPHRL